MARKGYKTLGPRTNKRPPTKRVTGRGKSKTVPYTRGPKTPGHGVQPGDKNYRDFD